MEIKVLPLKGVNSYFALQAYAKMLLGLFMLPTYAEKHDYHEFYEAIEKMPFPEQEKVIREGIFLGALERDEIMDLAQFASDVNGVPFSEENMKKLNPEEIFEILIVVCLECSKIKPRLITDTEKKKSLTSQ